MHITNFSNYVKNGLYANSMEQLTTIVKAFAGKNSNVFRIKLSKGIKLPNNAGEYLTLLLRYEAAKPGKRIQASHTRGYGQVNTYMRLLKEFSPWSCTEDMAKNRR